MQECKLFISFNYYYHHHKELKFLRKRQPSTCLKRLTVWFNCKACSLVLTLNDSFRSIAIRLYAITITNIERWGVVDSVKHTQLSVVCLFAHSHTHSSFIVYSSNPTKYLLFAFQPIHVYLFVFFFRRLFSLLAEFMANIFDKMFVIVLHTANLRLRTCWIRAVLGFSIRLPFCIRFPHLQTYFVYRCPMISTTFSIKYNWFRIPNRKPIGSPI